MTLKQIKVLLIEDDEEDFIVTKHFLKNIKTCQYIIDWEKDFNEALNRVILQEHDIYLVNYDLGTNNGLELVKQVINSGINVPFIFLTNKDDYSIDNEAMQVGAIDYLIKSKVSEDLLERSIRYAIGRKKTEQALIEANTTKDKLFSIISHDLRSPMGSLLNAIDIIMDSRNDIDPDTLSQLLRELQKTTKSAFNLLDNLLTWSRSQIGALRCRPVNIQPYHIIEEINIQLARTAKVKSISIVSNIEENLEVLADPNMLHTVIRNLISNAIKYTHEMGAINIDAIEEADTVTFIIKDNGIGMDEIILEKIFDPQLFESKKGTNNESGTGIGLKICYDFIARNNGILWAESKEGEGSTFFFSLPKN